MNKHREWRDDNALPLMSRGELTYSINERLTTSQGQLISLTVHRQHVWSLSANNTPTGQTKALYRGEPAITLWVSVTLISRSWPLLSCDLQSPDCRLAGECSLGCVSHKFYGSSTAGKRWEPRTASSGWPVPPSCPLAECDRHWAGAGLLPGREQRKGVMSEVISSCKEYRGAYWGGGREERPTRDWNGGRQGRIYWQDLVK